MRKHRRTIQIEEEIWNILHQDSPIKTTVLLVLAKPFKTTSC